MSRYTMSVIGLCIVVALFAGALMRRAWVELLQDEAAMRLGCIAHEVEIKAQDGSRACVPGRYIK